jgi:single-strand DNA-binding protein
MPSRATLRIVGHVGQDAETKWTKNGKEYVSFTVAVSNSHKDQTTKEWVKDPSDWYKVFCFQNKKSILDSVRKGNCVVVTGSPKYNAYISKKTGEPVVDLAIFANDVSLLCYDKKENSGGYGDAAFSDNIEAGMINLGDDSEAPEANIPF